MSKTLYKTKVGPVWNRLLISANKPIRDTSGPIVTFENDDSYNAFTGQSRNPSNTGTVVVRRPWYLWWRRDADRRRLASVELWDLVEPGTVIRSVRTSNYQGYYLRPDKDLTIGAMNRWWIYAGPRYYAIGINRADFTHANFVVVAPPQDPRIEASVRHWAEYEAKNHFLVEVGDRLMPRGSRWEYKVEGNVDSCFPEGGSRITITRVDDNGVWWRYTAADPNGSNEPERHLPSCYLSRRYFSRS